MTGTLPSAAPRRLVGIVAACLAALVLGAALADSASAATRVSYRAFDNQAPKTFFSKGGLQLRGECGPGADEIVVYARSTFENAMLHANSQEASNNYYEDDDFDAGAGNQVNLTANLGDDSNSGQLIYARPGGANVSVDWLAEEEDGYAGSRDCAFNGTARFVDAGSSGRANFRFNATTPATTFFNQGGLKLIGSCLPGGLAVTAKTSTDNSMIHANSQSTGNNVDALVDNDFDTADSFFLPDAVVSGLLDDATGQIVYGKPGGTNVTVDWSAEDGGDALGRDCVFNGTARVRSSGDPLRVNFRVPSGDAAKTLFNQGGLKLTGECDSGDLNVFVHTTSDHAMVHYNGQEPASAQSNEDDFFDTDPDDMFELFGNLALNNGEANSSGQIVYSEDGQAGGTNVTVRWAGQEDDGFFDHDCDFVGAAEIGKK